MSRPTFRSMAFEAISVSWIDEVKRRGDTTERATSQRGKFLLEVLQLPEILHHVVHRSPVGELLLKLDGLPGGLDVDEDVQQRGDDLEPVGMLWPKQTAFTISFS